MKEDLTRFDFGANWQSFVKNALTSQRIDDAVESLRRFLEISDLSEKTFLDVGCGSGLFSLAAKKLLAKVHSFDLDPRSVTCTIELRRVFFPDDEGWTIEQGDVLNVEYLNSLGQFDIVYSWGVLHHTGAMWKALENVIPLVLKGGNLFLSIYNDQGTMSRRWRSIKKFYNESSRFTKFIMMLFFAGCFGVLKVVLRLRKERGMSFWHDLIDWIGGYPFEVAKPEEIFEFYRDRGFVLKKLKTRGGKLGCNEFLFVRA